LFKAEIGTTHTPVWKITEEFVEKVIDSNNTIFYSGFVLKELMHKLSESEFKEKIKFFSGRRIFSCTCNYRRLSIWEKA